MFRICISCLVLLSTIIYCVVEKNNANKILKDNCIEVYLYKEFIPYTNCIKFNQSKYYKKNIDHLFVIEDKNYIDTLTLKITDGSKFPISLNKINSKPYLTNISIKKFHIKSNYIEIEKLDYIRLFKWKKNDSPKQFVLLLNKKPILNGYLFNAIYSYKIHDIMLLYSVSSNKTSKDFPLKSKSLIVPKLYLANIYPNYINLKKDYPELYHAFKNSNRLIE